MLQKLRQTLASVGKLTETFHSPDGTTVLMLPHGGRVLGLMAAGGDENFYWTHPALESEETARAFYESDVWHNSGGDRTWLAPEVDIFFPRYPDLDMSTYCQPRQLDPGNYQVVPQDGRSRMINRLELILSRTGQRVSLEMAKWVGPASNPLRHEPEWAGFSEVQYAGYTQHTTLALHGENPAGAHVGLWNHLQMPHGGEMLIPTHSRAVPKIYMGNIEPGDLVAGGQLVRYYMRARGEHKIGLRAVAMTGRVGYLYPAPAGAALIVRNFPVNPSGEYVDVPWRETGNFGFAVQACNVASGLGSFSELEYHTPAIGGAAGLDHYEDVSQIWAFRGPEDAVRAIARVLLSPQV